MSQYYTLYIHDDNESMDVIDDDDLLEPTAFQVSSDMKWNDLQDLITTEVGSKTKMSFTYIDDENDLIMIDSQGEYKTALELCHKMRRDLHIYAVKNGGRPKNIRQRKRTTEKKKEKKSTPVLPDLDKQEDEVEILRPPEEEEDASSASNLPEATVREPPIPYDEIESKSVPISINSKAEEKQSNPGAIPKLRKQEKDIATNLLSEKDPEETVPMVLDDAIYRMIKKEVQNVVGDEVNDIWRFITALKRDVNTELDTLGEHIEAVNRSKSQEKFEENKEELPQEPSIVESEVLDEEEKPEQDETSNFAATFICESLLDGSVVHTGEGFEKHWVFRNDGDTGWNENTKLHLLDETCDPTPATGGSLSEWGAKNKSVNMPPLKRGESGVVCAKHVAPAYACNYTSSWRLSHEENAFGPRVWCNVRVVSESSVDAEKKLGSFEVVVGEKTARKSLNDDGSLVPQEKLQVEVKSPKLDDGLHSDNSILSFNMTDISDGAKYIDGSTQEETAYNPAITSVEDGENKEDENIGASVDSEGSASPVMVSPPDFTEPEVQEEEPKTLENEEEKNHETTKEPVLQDNIVENFTEQDVVDNVESSDEEEEKRESPGRMSPRTSTSEDLHSVDYNMDDEGMSMFSNYESDFVVVPLPECFDVNKPLNVSEHEDVQEEGKTEIPAETTEPQSVEQTIVEESQTGEGDAQAPPSVASSSESEIESQPSSTTYVKEYKSEDSLPLAPKVAPKSPVTQSPVTSSKVSLAPAFRLQDDLPQAQDEPPQENADDESLTEKITKEFDAFLSNPQHPIEPQTQPKVTMNEMISTKSKVAPAPKPVPNSVLQMDQPYQLPDATPEFPPFDQGWRQNPIPLPRSVVNNDVWVPPPDDTPWQNPASTFQPLSPPEVASTFPPEPFAVASPSLSYREPQDFYDTPTPRRRPPSPDIPLADDFYPPGLNANDEEDIFRTPPPSPPPRGGSIELSPLDQLYEMGFHDLELNLDIFNKCEQDLNRTVQALILRAEADDDMVA